MAELAVQAAGPGPGHTSPRKEATAIPGKNNNEVQVAASRF